MRAPGITEVPRRSLLYDVSSRKSIVLAFSLQETLVLELPVSMKKTDVLNIVSMPGHELVLSFVMKPHSCVQRTICLKH